MKNYSPNQPNFQKEESPVPKRNWRKSCLIIFTILLIIIIGIGYLIFQKISMVTVEGNREKLTAQIPSGYMKGAIPKDKFTTPGGGSGVLVFNPVVNTKEEIESGIVKGVFAFIFFRDNKSNNVNTEIEEAKNLLEKLKTKAGTQASITETKINNYRAVKNEGVMKNCLAQNVDCLISEYWLVTEKSTFIISRTAPLDQPRFAEEDFNRMLDSVRITSKRITSK
jgi:hypothetical protein